MSDPTRSAADAAAGPTATPADPAATTPHAETPADAPAAPPPAPPGYELHAEVGHGGMGVVYRATDRSLGRDVAVKVLQDRYPPTGSAARRFLDEARVLGRLVHPAIPPVHALGLLPDGRPFLAMKLIRGSTLDALLAGGSADRGWLIGVFEQVCQAVAYAHAEGVIHRDLKPSNVMVGGFNEVQVMDWGLAKTGVRGQESGVREDPSVAATRGGAPDGITATGSVLGTPAYMAPEQARGEAVDARADVFALGGILCAILTGRPPFTGTDSESVRRRAAAGDVEEAFDRLDQTAADRELVALCRRCLSPDPAGRPADGTAVADEVGRLRAAAEDRIRRAEVDRARAEERAAADRHRARLRLVLAAAVALLVAAGGAFAWYREAERAEAARKQAEQDAAEARAAAEREAAKADAAAARVRLRDQAALAAQLAADLRRQRRYREAAAALGHADRLDAEARRLGDPGLPLAADRADLAFAAAADRTRYLKWYAPPNADHYVPQTGAGYQAAFAARGWDLRSPDPAALAGSIRASGVFPEAVAALDDWSLDRAHPLAGRALELARGLDRGFWADRVRDPAVRADPDRLDQLAREIVPSEVTPELVMTLAELMGRAKLGDAAVVRLLTVAQAAHPTAAEPAFSLGMKTQGRNVERAIGFFRVARAARPDNFVILNNLGKYLTETKEYPAAREVLREAARVAPDDRDVQMNYGVVLLHLKDWAGAAKALKAATAIDPGYADAYSNLGYALGEAGDKAGAVAALTKAAALTPDHPAIRLNLANALSAAGKPEAALAEYKKAVELAPDAAAVRFNYGVALGRRGDVEGALAEFRAAAKLDPGNKQYQAAVVQTVRAKADRDARLAPPPRPVKR